MMSSTGAFPLQVQYCIRRDDGRLVPLVPADMLPDLPLLSSIPRMITAEQALEARVSLVGVNTSAPASGRLTPTTLAYGAIPSAPSLTTSLQASPTPATAVMMSVRTYTEVELEQIRHVLRRGVKIWCSKWLDTRDCAFQQQGCRYKHEIPPRGLWKELGFPHGRPWWTNLSTQENLQKTLAMMRAPSTPSDTAGSNSSDVSKNRLKVPASATGARPSIDMSSPGKLCGDMDGTNETAKATVSKQQPSEEVSLIDFDDEELEDDDYKPQPVTLESPECGTPAPKKLKTEASNIARNGRSEVTPVRTFVPAGESPIRHVAAARQHHRRRQGHGSQRTQPKAALSSEHNGR